MRIALFLLALVSVTTPARADGKLLTVLEMHSKLAGDEQRNVDAGYLADRVRAAVLDEKLGVQVMTRENMLVLLQAQGKDLADCEGECEVDTGRRLGVDYVISGDLLRLGSSLKLSLKLHETQTATLLGAVSASGDDVNALDASVPAAVKQLLAPLRPAAESREAPPIRALPPGLDSVTMQVAAPPDGRWQLVNEAGAVLCQLPCAQKLQRGMAYFAERDADRTEDRTRIRLPDPASFAPGRSVAAEYRSSFGSRTGSVLLATLGLASAAAGVGLISAEHTQYCYSGNCYDSAQSGLGTATTRTSPSPGLGVAAVGGGSAVAVLGIVFMCLSHDEHYEAKLTGEHAQLGLLPDGLALRF